jgi:hypothetical protein
MRELRRVAIWTELKLLAVMVRAASPFSPRVLTSAST